jgi:carbamoyl-phosphate synthase large subunit
MKKIMILGASDFQVPLIVACKKLGYETYVVDYDDRAMGFNYADHKLLLSTIDEDAVLKAFSANFLDAIITNSDYPVRVVAKVCEKLSLPGLSYDSALLTTDKYYQRKTLFSKGLSMPAFNYFRNIDELKEATKNMKYPLILKPVDSSASRGVSKVLNEGQLSFAADFAIFYSKSKKGIVEEFISGREFSVEILVQKGICNVIAVTEKTTDGDNGSFFVETMQVVPADITRHEYDKIVKVSEKTVSALKIDNSAVHLELKIFNGEPVIIEVAARLGGDCITTDLVPLATGVDMVNNIIKISLGQKIDTVHIQERHAGIQFITYKNYDVAINKINALKKDDRLVRYLIENKKAVSKLESSNDRLGYFICVSDSRQSLMRMLEV